MGLHVEKSYAIIHYGWKQKVRECFWKYGWIPEWPKGADCKSVGDAFEGSNPSPSIKLNVMVRKESSWEKPKRFESFSIHSHY